jgi:hypothetical protein
MLTVISHYFDRCIEICTSLNVIIGIDTAAMSPESSCYKKKMTQNIDYLDCLPVNEKLLDQPNKIVFLPKVSYIAKFPQFETSYNSKLRLTQQYVTAYIFIFIS